eukprot:TRINITY_DN12530_c0_g1_i1.p1 TRINITY_DN12530_c0_g1~~TRINITY_DN12530_c0_g1_i1.p1  ORF type:complete len:132 (-),score=8.60 TRINITY_DN12530_c0_g1_i1:60-455(-)
MSSDRSSDEGLNAATVTPGENVSASAGATSPVAGLLSLPDEVLELCAERLSPAELGRLAQCHSRLRDVAMSAQKIFRQGFAAFEADKLGITDGKEAFNSLLEHRHSPNVQRYLNLWLDSFRSQLENLNDKQ